MPRYALLSVSDKTGLVDFARGLVEQGFHILSTGGTAAALTSGGIPLTKVSKHTGFPEIMGGRVKTLHPMIHGGILGRRGEDDAVATEHGIGWIDVVAVNLYPFEATVAKAGVSLADAIENIDIGGPAMVRASAKNHAHVCIVVDPADYPAVLAQREDAAFRARLAVKAFRHTATYDAVISSWLGERLDPEPYPAEMAIPLRRLQACRYGENPHQSAAFYAVPGEGGRSLARAVQLQGKELSYNNLGDLDAAVRLAFEFDEPAVAIIKHANPCGCAVHPAGLGAAYTLALSADPVSAYGGILALNRALTGADAKVVAESKVFFEVIAAPGIDEEARAIFAKRANLRVLELPADWAAAKPAGRDQKRVAGGMLLQDWDVGHTTAWTSRLRAPAVDEARALAFAWKVCANVKSNAIVLARTEDGGVVTNGVGAGQMSRVDSVRLAVAKATRPVAGSVLASDAFFPFADGVEAAAAAGVTAIVQPGGSIRDDEVAAAAEQAGMAMELTGARHFRH